MKNWYLYTPEMLILQEACRNWASQWEGRFTSPPHPLRPRTPSGMSSCCFELMLSAECVEWNQSRIHHDPDSQKNVHHKPGRLTYSLHSSDKDQIRTGCYILCGSQDCLYSSPIVNIELNGKHQRSLAKVVLRVEIERNIYDLILPVCPPLSDLSTKHISTSFTQQKGSFFCPWEPVSVV